MTFLQWDNTVSPSSMFHFWFVHVISSGLYISAMCPSSEYHSSGHTVASVPIVSDSWVELLGFSPWHLVSTV